MDDNGLPLLPLVLDNVPEGLRYVLAQEGIPFCDRGGGPPRGRFVLVDSSAQTRRTLSPGELPIDIARLREMSQGDPLAAILDRRTVRAEWTFDDWHLRGRLPAEDRRTLHREVVEFLRSRVERLGGVWIRIAAFPAIYRSVLNWRVDCPTPHESTVVSGALPFSYFLSSAAAANSEAIARLQGQDMGVLAENLFMPLEDRVALLDRTIKTMAAAGVVARGVATTESSCRADFLAALERLGVEHQTGNVGCDEMPWFSASGGLLHLPVHAISLGMFLQAARQGSTARWSPTKNHGGNDRRAESDAAAAAADYFCRLLESRCRSGEPVLLGSRASDLLEQPNVLEAVARRVADLPGLWPATLAQWVRWWRARAAARVSVAREEGRLIVTCRHPPADHTLAVEFCRGDHAAVLPLERPQLVFSPEALAFENRRPQPLVRPVRLDAAQRFRPAGRIVKEEPAPTIHPLTNWARRQIRRLWG